MASPRPLSQTLAGVGAIAGLAGGIAMAVWKPAWPLLTYWLWYALFFGLWISATRTLHGLRERARWLVVLNAIVVFAGLLSTQVAARRAISAIHLRYDGVLVEDAAALTIGSGADSADIQLPVTSTTQMPWSIRVTKASPGWLIQPLAGVEEIRIGARRPGVLSAFFGRAHDDDVVLGSVALQHDGDFAVVADSAGRAIDTLTLRSSDEPPAIHSRVARYDLASPNGRLEARYELGMRGGFRLATLSGPRSASSAYEHFIRVRQRDQSLGDVSPLPRYLLTAASPFTVRGTTAAARQVSFRDSAAVEVRQGEMRWTFTLRNWRRAPSANPGLALFFKRNPRPPDSPLPAGVNCPPNAACGALSLRRLPAPIAHVSLDEVGFDANRFGLLGMLASDADGVVLSLPRESIRIPKGNRAPTAVPVVRLDSTQSETRPAPGHPKSWVLLSASGALGDESAKLWLIGGGLSLLLIAVSVGVATTRISPRIDSPRDEHVIGVGITAILGLLVTRLIIGARVAFFPPFLSRGIETAVGMWVAVALVTLALLSWAEWMPALLVRARHAFNGQASLALTIRAPQQTASPRQNLSLVLIVAGIACLAYASPAAVVKGLVTGALVLLAWVTVAWITAFASPVFETFERGAWSVVEQLAPQRGVHHWWDAVPESWLIVACLCAELALRWPRSLALLSVLVIIAAVIPRRARHTPDPIAAAAGAALFTLCIALNAAVSENGSMAAFVLVVFVALASVRIGRAVQGRLADAQPGARSRYLPLVLIAPLLLLAQLALIDMGLFLVVVLPIGFATLLAVDSRVARRAMLVPAAAFALLAALLIGKVLFPSVDEIRRADSHLAKAEAFGHMSQLFHVSLPGSFGQSMNRVAARALATRDPGLAEEMLVSAQPGPARDLLIPSIEQIWGAKAYSEGGLTGLGLGRAVIGGRGVAEAVSYAENAFSVFVLAEHGALGGVTILALYILLAGAALFASLSNGGTPASHRASRALFIVATLLLVIPAVYVALSNLGYVPITGQNMPFLGLNSWSDVALCSGAVGILITGLVRRAEGEP